MSEKKELPPPKSALAAKRDALRGPFLVITLTICALAGGGGLGKLLETHIEKKVEHRLKAEAEKEKVETPYSGDISVRSIPAVVTNLADSETEWIRLETSIVFKNDQSQNAALLAAETRQDMLTYLRTVSLAQIQGPSGLLHLREDLNERAHLRSKGAIQELIVESLVVQ